MSEITVTLTAYNMGDVTEADFDAWARYVGEHMGPALSVEFELDQHPFEGGPDRDTVRGASEEQREAIRGWLAHDGWDAFCGDAAVWPAQQTA